MMLVWEGLGWLEFVRHLPYIITINGPQPEAKPGRATYHYIPQ